MLRRPPGSTRSDTLLPYTTLFRSPTDPQVALHLGRFIEQVRSIPADPIIVRQNWLRAYDFTTTRGAVALNEYARANDPFSRVGQVQIRSEEHTSELQSLMRISYAVFCLKKKKTFLIKTHQHYNQMLIEYKYMNETTHKNEHSLP